MLPFRITVQDGHRPLWRYKYTRTPVLHGRCMHHQFQQPAFERGPKGKEVSEHGQIQSPRANARVSRVLGYITLGTHLECFRVTRPETISLDTGLSTHPMSTEALKIPEHAKKIVPPLYFGPDATITQRLQTQQGNGFIMHLIPTIKTDGRLLLLYIKVRFSVQPRSRECEGSRRNQNSSPGAQWRSKERLSPHIHPAERPQP